MKITTDFTDRTDSGRPSVKSVESRGWFLFSKLFSLDPGREMN